MKNEKKKKVRVKKKEEEEEEARNLRVWTRGRITKLCALFFSPSEGVERAFGWGIFFVVDDVVVVVTGCVTNAEEEGEKH